MGTVRGGGGGATNLPLTPITVSGAPGALGRPSPRSPWIGGHVQRFMYAETKHAQTEKISPLEPDAHVHMRCTCTDEEEGRRVFAESLQTSSSSPPQPQHSQLEISFLPV